ncbi:ArsR/SmtB family transcription factor [Clostridium autoethanogenum]|uniref:Metalloregulator ArsR/SmtB family transcription factor n=1 Tax=Clostridium autoethanogenum DSM 10061 TaxID=1341692 RepID=A0ABN4BAS9_9CLOT|nr:metalloregulator ArsR/SmtB family transcription factor [Clostridium autoethanogenum]AGY74498.1 metalloregulator ArsR/SmtB family transcription factor [Clostridium autoethanogenum DSM 10061]ALU34686.1 Transcriptional regulator ArsR family [Clostridium autoethanogenum DSM 10061]OVY51405.1 Transcriptional repressor PagR [Clostridium autoethanogenum]
MDNNYKEYADTAELLKVLAHPIRLCIVRGLSNKGCCNVTHMQNCLKIPQSTLSQHLQKLRTAKIIEGTRNGLEVNYNVCNKTAIDLIHVLFK